MKQAYTYTSIKNHKEWNRVTNMTLEQIVIHRWNLTKTMLIMEGMTPFIKSWHLNLPSEIQDLPLCRTDFYFGRTIMDTFNASFKFPTLEEHYRSVLESMKEETAPKQNGTEQMHNILSRAFKVNGVYAAVPTLHFRLYIDAVLDPFRGQATQMKMALVDFMGTPACGNSWPHFFTYLQQMITNRGIFSKTLFNSTPAANDEKEQPKSPGRNNWQKNRPNLAHERRPYSPKFNKKPRVHFGGATPMSTIKSHDEYDDHEYHEDDYGDEDHEEQSKPTSKMNSLSSNDQQLLDHMTNLTQALSTKLESKMNKDIGSLRGQIADAVKDHYNSIMTPSKASSTQSSTTGSQPRNQGGGGGHQKRKSKANSNKPVDNRPNNLDHYGPNAKQRHDNKRQRSDNNGDRVDRHQYNPKGSEHWKLWLRVCAKCGKFGGHLQYQCQDEAQPGYDPNADPRLAIPIEPYPANEQAALQRCRQEYQRYGNRVKWNCYDNQAPQL